MGRVKEAVREKLAGMEVRQRQRDAARRFLTQQHTVYRARREGLLDSRDDCESILRHMGIGWEDESYYGVTIRHTHAGVTLAYDPSGKLSWGTRQPSPGESVQEVLEFVA